jgi:hypothetical protein
MTEKQLVEKLRSEIAQAGTPYKWAKAKGVERSVVSRVLTGGIKVPPALARALGYVRSCEYVRIVDKGE